MNALGVHTYAGGLAVGVARYFTLAGLCEHDGYGDAIKTLNFPGVPLYPRYDQWPRTRGRGTQATQLIFGNPPCAPFSVASAGRSTGWGVDPRLQFWRDIVALIPQSQPDILAIESVVPAWTAGRQFINGLAGLAAGWGYSTTVLLHNAMYLGAVQNRKRVFFVFHKVAVDQWPTPPTFDTEITVRKVLKGVKVPAATKKQYAKQVELTGLMKRLHEETAPGGSLRSTFDRLFGADSPRGPNGFVTGRPGFLNHKLNMDTTGKVYIGSCIYHPTEPRGMYPEEINAYAGFPPDWKWPTNISMGKLSTFAAQGVSPLGGAWLGQGALEAIQLAKRIVKPDYAIMDGLSKRGWELGRVIISHDPVAYHGGPKIDLTPPAPVVLPWDPAKPAKEPRAARPPGQGLGAFIRGLLVQGVDTASILEQVKAKFPASKATASDVAWNKGRLRKEGVEV